MMLMSQVETIDFARELSSPGFLCDDISLSFALYLHLGIAVIPHTPFWFEMEIRLNHVRLCQCTRLAASRA